MATRRTETELSKLGQSADDGNNAAVRELTKRAKEAGFDPDEYATWAELAQVLDPSEPEETPRRTRRTRTNGDGNGTTRRRTRRTREVVPMTPAVKSAAMQALTAFESALGEEAGFEGSSTRNGKNGSLSKSIRIDGHRATVRVLYR